MRRSKNELKRLLAGADWQANLERIAIGGQGNVGALFSFLLYGPELMHRAARALGLTIAGIHEVNAEAARNIIRRFMWHMNEDSGNIGWGIPDAFGEALAASEPLAQSYNTILISYIMDLGIADNYCDYAPLRRECYWAVGRVAQARPQLMEKARIWLVKGLADADSICRGMAAWALGQLAPELTDAPALSRLAQANDNDNCEIFAGAGFAAKTVSAWGAWTLAGKVSRK